MKSTRTLGSLVLVLAVCSQGRDIPSSVESAYSSLGNVLPYRMHGWFNSMTELDTIFSGKAINSVVELGSWLGFSTAFMAQRLAPGGKVFAIDVWDTALPEYQRSAPNYLPRVYDQFLSNMVRLNLTDSVVPIQDTTLGAAEYITRLPGYTAPEFIYVDADHSLRAILADIRAWYPFLAKGGLMCGHDIQLDSTRNAVTRYAQEHGLGMRLLSPDTWCFDPKDSEPISVIEKNDVEDEFDL